MTWHCKYRLLCIHLVRSFCMILTGTDMKPVKGGSWDQTACASAAKRHVKVHPEVLEYARSHGCPWDGRNWYAAAESGQLAALHWARRLDPNAHARYMLCLCRCWTSSNPAVATNSGSSMPLGVGAYTAATAHGWLNVDPPCPWDEPECKAVATCTCQVHRDVIK